MSIYWVSYRLPGPKKSEHLCLEVWRFDSIAHNSALFCLLLNMPQNGQSSLTQNIKMQVGKKNWNFHGNLQFNSKRTIKVNGKSHTITLREV